jgi:hypothetical protein
MRLYLARTLSLPVASGTHRKPLRTRLYGPPLALLAMLATVAALFAVHVLIWYHGVNAGVVLRIPLLPHVGYEYRGVPGFFWGSF